MKDYKIFEYGRRVGLLQAEIVMRSKKKAVVVCGEDEIVFYMDDNKNKRWIFDKSNRYDKLIGVMEMVIKK